MSTRDERLRAIDACVFRTITGEDWKRQMAAARMARNPVRDQIRKKILDLKLGKLPCGKVGADASGHGGKRE